MPDYSFNACLKNIEDDDYAKFKEDYELGVTDEESEYLLRASIMNHRKFFVEYLARTMNLTEDQIYGCQVLSSSNQDLGIFNLFIEGKITPQAWVNIFNLHTLETIKDLVSKKGKPTESLLVILQYALANPSAEVHDFSFDELFDKSLIEQEDAKANLVDCICFSGNLKLLERLEGTEELLIEIEAKQNKHIEFSKKLDEYTDVLYETTAKEKVAGTVNTLGLMEHIREKPDVEDWDIIIQDYLLNEDIISNKDDMSDGCVEVAGLLGAKKLALLEISKISPNGYIIEATNLLNPGKEYNLALDRRIHDISALYTCYLVEIDENYYITSHPLFILPSKKSMIQLGLRKEKDKKQQASNKKNKSKSKKASSKVSLNSKEIYKYLLDMHIQSRKEIDDNV